MNVKTLLAGLCLLGLAGCGGGGAPELVTIDPPVDHAEGLGTARFRVNLDTGEVQVAALKAPSGRGQIDTDAVLDGASIQVNTATLVDDPGSPGVKVISVQFVNRTGMAIGVLPTPDSNFGVAGSIKAVFSPIVAPDSGRLDFRPLTTVTNLAGGAAGFADGAASQARFNAPSGVAAITSNFNINLTRQYVADTLNNRIRMVENGVVTTVAGDGTAGFADGLGSGARFNGPVGIAAAFVFAGTFFQETVVVADTLNNRIRLLSRAGKVVTIAGTGAAGSADGAGNAATFTAPQCVAIDSSGVIFVTEENSRVRKIEFTGTDREKATDYTVSTIKTGLSSPRGIAVDTPGSIYVAEFGAHRILRLAKDGSSHVLAGTGAVGSVDGPGDVAKFSSPFGIAALQETLFVSDLNGRRIRQLWLRPGSSPGLANNWLVGTIAGSGVTGSSNGTGDVATFAGPRGLAVDASGRLVVADRANHRLRSINPASGFFPIGVSDGTGSTEPVRLMNASGHIGSERSPFVETRVPNAPGLGNNSAFNQTWAFSVPQGVTLFEFTVTIYAPTGVMAPVNAVVSPVTPPNGSPDNRVLTLAGQAKIGLVDGPSTQALFGNVRAVDADGEGNLFVVDALNHCIRLVDVTGLVSTIAGNGSPGNVNNANGLLAQFSTPTGIAVSQDGTTVVVLDSGNSSVRVLRGFVPPPGFVSNAYAVSTVVSSATPGTGSVLATNGGLDWVGSGSIAIADTGNHRIVVADVIGQIGANQPNVTTRVLAGTTAGFADGAAGVAQFDNPTDVAFDEQGNVLVADFGNRRIRKVDPFGNVTTVAGTGSSSESDGPALGSGVTPLALDTDKAGNVYFVGGAGVKRLSPGGTVATVSHGNLVGDGPGDIASFLSSHAICADIGGQVYADGQALGPSGVLSHVVVKSIHRVIRK